MIYKAKEIQLKNNVSALLRSPTEQDAEQMVEYLKTVCAETPFLVREPEEAEIPQEKERRLLKNIADSENDLMIACVIDGRIVGNCNLNRQTKLRMRHRADIGIAIFEEFWGLGLGRIMLSELICLAEELGIEQLELEVISENERAIRLYESLGFVPVGEKPNAFRLKDGTAFSEISMIKGL